MASTNKMNNEVFDAIFCMSCLQLKRRLREAPGPCPALELQEDGRKICGLMKSPAKYAVSIRASASRGPLCMAVAVDFRSRRAVSARPASAIVRPLW